MPSIPVATPLGYTGVFLVIAGIFLIIAGLDILKIEKLTVTTGRKTWVVGLLLAVIGTLFLLPDISLAINSSVVSTNIAVATQSAAHSAILPTNILPTETPPLATFTSTLASTTTLPPLVVASTGTLPPATLINTLTPTATPSLASKPTPIGVERGKLLSFHFATGMTRFTS